MIHQSVSMVSQCGAWMNGLASGDQRRRSAVTHGKRYSASESCSRRHSIQIHRYFTLLCRRAVSVSLFVCSAVRQLVYYVQKSIHFFSPSGRQTHHLSFSVPNLIHDNSPTSNAGDMKKSRFSTHISLYLGNDAR